MLIRCIMLALVAVGVAQASTVDCQGTSLLNLSFQSLDPTTIVSCGAVQYTGFSFSDGGYSVPLSDVTALFVPTSLTFGVPEAEMFFGIEDDDASPITANSSVTMSLSYEISATEWMPFYAGALFANFSVDGSGSIMITSNKCFGAPFSSGNCPATGNLVLSVSEIAGRSTSTTDSRLTLYAAFNVWVVDTIVFSAGGSGLIPAVDFQDVNVAQPDPASSCLTMLGLAFLLRKTVACGLGWKRA
jgi:hypothetical protein